MFKISYLLVLLILSGCAQPKKNVVHKNVFENQELKAHKKINKLEGKLLDLKIQNDILVQALREKNENEKIINSPYKQFPKFDELIFDQAKKAFESNDIPRLEEAIRILRSNQPDSPNLDPIYYWLVQLQVKSGKFNQALITANNFLKFKPKSSLVPNLMFVKGQIYENMNLKIQAMDVYKMVKNLYPGHVMAGLAIDKINKLSPGDFK